MKKGPDGGQLPAEPEDFTAEAEECDATPVEPPPMCQPGQPGQENLQVTTTESLELRLYFKS